MTRIDPRGLCAAVSLACLAALSSVAAAQPAAPASAPVFAYQDAAIDLPTVPHERQPASWPQPDYVTEALKLTSVRTSAAAKAVRLRGAGGDSPATIVLPVQVQAFGFSPTFRALLGAQLDHELAARRVDANRQTDVFDVNGPFVRRLDDATIDEIAAVHPSSRVLGLYIGHDGVDTVFLTLVLRDRAGTRRAHRGIPIAADWWKTHEIEQAASEIAGQLPAMLAELKLGTAAPPAPTTPVAGACSTQSWQFETAVGTQPGALACRAIAVGMLMPSGGHVHHPDSPARMAWLATALVEARALQADSPSQQAIARMAAQALRPEAEVPPRADAVLADPVVAPLAQMLTAYESVRVKPVVSERAAMRDLIERAAAPLPPFARTLLVESGMYFDPFTHIDLCAIEHELPGMPSARCRSDDTAGATRPAARRAGLVESALFQEWRLAAYMKEIQYYGFTVGQRDRLLALLKSLPDDVASHPRIRQLRFATQRLDRMEGSFPVVLQQLQAMAAELVQATADLQRSDDVLQKYALSRVPLIDNSRISADPRMAELADDEARLLAVMEADGYTYGGIAARREAGDPAAFLSPGPFRKARMAAMSRKYARQRPPPTSAAIPVPAAASAPSPAEVARMIAAQPLFPVRNEPAAPPPTPVLRENVARQPGSMDARTALAMRLLAEGQPLAEARKVVDAYPASERSDDRIGLSHAWAGAGHKFYFTSDVDVAKDYYRLAREVGSGSDSELHAAVRLRTIDGDIRGAVDAARVRDRRYQNDFTRRDLAALLFMTGGADEAWPLLTSRMVLTSTTELWSAALAGHRIARLDLAAVKSWVDEQGVDGGEIQYSDSTALYLYAQAVIDRAPGDAELALLQGGTGLSSQYSYRRWKASARLVQLLMRGDVTAQELDAWRSEIGPSTSRDNRFMLPAFTWVAWHATRGQHPELARVRAVHLESGDFNGLLSKAMLLALEGDKAGSLNHLRAARFAMASLSDGTVFSPLPQPYQYALGNWLMYRKTGDEAYRAEALRFARACQHMFPSWAWAYALEGLLERDAKRQAVALCRARFLDAGSYFLSQAKPLPATRGMACPKAPW